MKLKAFRISVVIVTGLVGERFLITNLWRKDSSHESVLLLRPLMKIHIWWSFTDINQKKLSLLQTAVYAFVGWGWGGGSRYSFSWCLFVFPDGKVHPGLPVPHPVEGAFKAAASHVWKKTFRDISALWKNGNACILQRCLLSNLAIYLIAQNGLLRNGLR